MRYDFGGSKKRGCPTCGGVDPKSCMRCQGKTRLGDWENKEDFTEQPISNDLRETDYDGGQNVCRL